MLRTLAPLGLLLFFAPRAAAGVWYVDAALTTGAADGSSWADAFQGAAGLQEALGLAVAGDQVFVAQGTYVPAAVGQRGIAFRMVSGIEIYGGFLGGEASPAERPPFGLAPSILSGDLAGDDGSGAVGENSYHVVRASGTDPSALLDGFVVTGGNSNSGGNNDRGGGVLCINDANATFRNCSFEGNRCTFGGGAGYINGSAPTFVDCSFVDNQGGSFGGAFDIATAGAVTFDRCRFEGNRAARAGALEVFATAGVVVSNSVFVDNEATGSGGGGGLWIGSGSDTLLVNSTIVGNRAPFQENGGLRVQTASPTVVSCIFWDNEGPGGAQAAANQVSTGTSVSWSIVEGGFPGTGNLALDPLFEGAGSLALTPGSPAIDAGDTLSLPPGLVLDRAGLPRRFDDPLVADTGTGTAPVVDIGAFEFQGADAILVFCSGDGSGTSCPCANPGASDEGCANSTGGGAAIGATGSTGAAADDLVVTGSGLTPFQPGLCFVGTATISGGDGAVFGDGLRCVGGTVVRLGIVPASPAGTATWGPGLGALGGWSAGDTRYFQLWYRDPSGTCGSGFNLSSALEVTFGL